MLVSRAGYTSLCIHDSKSKANVTQNKRNFFKKIGGVKCADNKQYNYLKNNNVFAMAGIRQSDFCPKSDASDRFRSLFPVRFRTTADGDNRNKALYKDSTKSANPRILSLLRLENSRCSKSRFLFAKSVRQSTSPRAFLSPFISEMPCRRLRKS